MSRFRMFVPICFTILLVAAGLASAAEKLAVDFGYKPPQWRTAICPPDDPYKTLVDEQGQLLYHYPGRGRWFGTHVAVKIAPEAKTVNQRLVSPRVAIIETRQEAADLEILQEAFAVREEGPARRPARATAQRKDGSGIHRDWAQPGGDATAKLATIDLHGNGPIRYAIRVRPGTTPTVALGLCEGWHDRPGQRILSLSVEGASPRQVDTVAELGRNVAGAFWFTASDANGDGWIDLTVAPAPSAPDKNAILNGFWVFDDGVERDDAALLAGRLDEQAAMVHYAGDRDNISRNDVVLVRVANKGAEARTVEPQVVVDSDRKIEAMKDHVRVDGHEAVIATHPVASVSQKARKNGRVATMTLAPIKIEPGQTAEFAVVYCGGGRVAPGPATTADARKARRDCQAFWENVKLPYGRVTVPDEGIQALLDSSIRNIWQAREIKNGLPAFQVGATCYRALFIVDGAFILEAATLVGAGQDVRAGIEYMLSFQQDDGRFEILPRYHKENGIVLWTCVRHAMLTQDKKWLDSVWPRLAKTVAYIKHLRQLSREDDSPLNDGLMPRGFPDGGIGWAHYEYSNVYWNLLGLKAAIGAAHWLGRDAEAAAWQREFDDFYAVFCRAAARDSRSDLHGNRYLHTLMTVEDDILRKEPLLYCACKAQWAFCHGVYPGQLFKQNDPLVKGNLDMLATYEREGMITTTGWLTDGIWNYFASFYGHALLWQGDGRGAAEQLYAFANHASPLLAWLEEQGYRGKTVYENGDMPHNWASGEFIRLAVHMLALDRGRELHLFEALPVEWTQPGMITRLDRVPTPFGLLTVALTVSDDGKSATLTTEPLGDPSCRAIVVHCDWAGGGDGKSTLRLEPGKKHRMTIPIRR